MTKKSKKNKSQSKPKPVEENKEVGEDQGEKPNDPKPGSRSQKKQVPQDAAPIQPAVTMVTRSRARGLAIAQGIIPAPTPEVAKLQLDKVEQVQVQKEPVAEEGEFAQVSLSCEHQEEIDQPFNAKTPSSNKPSSTGKLPNKKKTSSKKKKKASKQKKKTQKAIEKQEPLENEPVDGENNEQPAKAIPEVVKSSDEPIDVYRPKSKIMKADVDEIERKRTRKRVNREQLAPEDSDLEEEEQDEQPPSPVAVAEPKPKMRNNRVKKVTQAKVEAQQLVKDDADQNPQAEQNLPEEAQNENAIIQTDPGQPVQLKRSARIANKKSSGATPIASSSDSSSSGAKLKLDCAFKILNVKPPKETERKTRASTRALLRGDTDVVKPEAREQTRSRSKEKPRKEKKTNKKKKKNKGKKRNRGKGGHKQKKEKPVQIEGEDNEAVLVCPPKVKEPKKPSRRLKDQYTFEYFWPRTIDVPKDLEYEYGIPDFEGLDLCFIKERVHQQTVYIMDKKTSNDLSHVGWFVRDIPQQVRWHVSGMIAGNEKPAVYYLVSWCRRVNGYKPGDIFIKGVDLAMHAPRLYQEYMQKFSILLPQNIK